MSDVDSEVIIPAVRLTGLSKRFRSQVAVDRLNIEVKCGSIFGLLGPNGAGKSTTIRMLVGLTSPDDGEIELWGDPIETRSVELKQRIGYVPELHRLYRWMTVHEIIRFTSAFYPKWDDLLCEQLLAQFELPTSRRVSKLSKGMTAKLGLLLALSSKPDLLVLDEPTSGLDPIVREEFLDGILRSKQDHNPTILFSSHHVDDVSRISDRIGIMDGGRLILCEEASLIQERVQSIRGVLEDGRLPQWIPPQAVWSRVNRRDWQLTVYPYEKRIIEQIKANNPVASLETESLSLDDIFKHLIRGRKASARVEGQ
ncbi:MAG: ABC transporter ATP-binding protein [Planctomycetales bacterium]|nr:ABC transporter ATP-binding protein [Planctomycetales bacterium]